MNIARCYCLFTVFFLSLSSPCPKSICNAYVKRNVNTEHFFSRENFYTMDALSECAKFSALCCPFCYCDGLSFVVAKDKKNCHSEVGAYVIFV